MGAAELILFGEVRARRLCYKNGLRLREGCLDAQSAGQANPLCRVVIARCFPRRAVRC
jgi:hypothetical protein